MPEKNTLPNKERMKIARTHMPEQDPADSQPQL